MPTADSKRRWFRFSPDRLVISSLLVVCLLWLSDRFQWFGFNHHKGWTVLIAVAAVGVSAVVMLLWWIASLILRWRFQFGIRSPLAFCLTCSIVVSWLAAEMKQARRQAEVVERIRSSDGDEYGKYVGYDWEFDLDGMFTPIGTAPPGPGWLRKLLGVDFFSAVVIVNDETTDAALEEIANLSELQYLSVSDSKITDAGLDHLKGLVHLLGLNLSDTKITDAGLLNLDGLIQLQSLELTDTEVTDAGVKRLQQALPNCKIIH